MAAGFGNPARFDPRGQQFNPQFIGISGKGYTPGPAKSILHAALNDADIVASMATGARPSLMAKTLAHRIAHPGSMIQNSAVGAQPTMGEIWGPPEVKSALHSSIPDSALIDVYHGSAKTFGKHEIQPASPLKNQGVDALGKGVYVTRSKGLASRYAELRSGINYAGQGEYHPGATPNVKLHQIDARAVFDPNDVNGSIARLGLDPVAAKNLKAQIVNAPKQRVADVVKSHGFQSVKSGDDFVVFDPQHVHPKFAPNPAPHSLDPMAGFQPTLTQGQKAKDWLNWEGLPAAKQEFGNAIRELPRDVKQTAKELAVPPWAKKPMR